MRSAIRPDRPRRLGPRALAGAALLAACAWSCARSAPGRQELLLDPQLVPAEQASFEQSFADGPASIRLGAGWQIPEKGPAGSHRPGLAWAEQHARIYFGVPLAPAADLVAVGLPLVFPGAPPQVLRPVLNGRRLADQPMPAGWSELRVPLPSWALRSPINTLDLHFAYEAVPAKVGLGGDQRQLAAAFDVLAVVPHGAPLAAEDDGATAAGSGRRLLLSRRPWALPLPPARRVEVELGAVHHAVPGLRLGIDLATWDNRRRRIWQGPADEAFGRSLSISVAGQRPARLLFELEEGGGEAVAPAQPVWMEPPAIRSVPALDRRARRPHVFIYLIDTLRADALGVYGSRRPASPRIDEFSRDAVVFDQAASASSWTLPSTFSVLSGLYPSHHGLTLPGDRLAADVRAWLPEVLARQGYETLGITQWLLGADAFGLDRGFDSFYMNIRQADKQPSPAARWFLWQHLLRRRHPEQPLFTFLHVVDPHALYRPVGEDARFARERPGTLPLWMYDPNYFMARGLGRNPADLAHLRALYDGEVHAADRAFGTFVDLLKFFGLYDDSVIVLLSDHGEEFAEHGGYSHGRTLYDELVRVPLIVKLPRGQGAGTRAAAPVSLVDVAPTLAALAGAAPADLAFDGLPLPPAGPAGAGGLDDPAGGRRRIYAETHAEAVNLRSVRLGSLKCIRSLSGIDQFAQPAPACQCFDLAADPRERSPLAAADRRTAPCRTLLLAPLPGAGARVLHVPLTAETAANLRALGYIR